MKRKLFKLLSILLTLLFLFSCSYKEENKIPLKKDSTFSITFLDVGNGDSIIIESDGEYMLLDGGKPEASSIVYSYLKNNNISELKYIGCTHPDSDHIGGLSGALQYATPQSIMLYADNYEEVKEFNNFIKYIDSDSTSLTIVEAGDNYTLGSANIEVVGPINRRDGDNNNSMILRITFGDTSFLLMGDAEVEEEEDILYSNIRSDLIKIGHHGSHSSSSERFISRVNPDIAVICCGENSYGHPHIETLELLKEEEITLYRTDLHGDIKCKSDGEDITCTPSKQTNLDVYSRYNQTNESININEYTYIGNINSKKFHRIDCEVLKDTKEKNKIYFTISKEEIISEGYEPCKQCNP